MFFYPFTSILGALLSVFSLYARSSFRVRSLRSVLLVVLRRPTTTALQGKKGERIGKKFFLFTRSFSGHQRLLCVFPIIILILS